MCHFNHNAMKVNLKKYMDSRDAKRESNLTPGPFLTLSRSYGCRAAPLAELLVTKIAELSTSKINQGWQILNKEILDEAAEELRLVPHQLETMLETRSTGASQMLSAFASGSTPTDSKISHVLEDVFNHHAMDGKVIIVGRAGAQLTRKLANGLHIRLSARQEWRVQQIAAKYEMSHADALARVAEMDMKRAAWLGHVGGNITDDQVYDMILNRETLDQDLILENILFAMASKQMIKIDR